MNEESDIRILPENKKNLGNKVREIAAQLRQEDALQIKATSRILGAAAKIAINHDRLIAEVVDMVQADLARQSAEQQSADSDLLQEKGNPQSYTLAQLKQQFGTLAKAKTHFGISVRSWADLIQKLNGSSEQKQADSEPMLERLQQIEDEIKMIRADVNQILFLLKQVQNLKSSGSDNHRESSRGWGS
uniref:Uncharacterized protein n=1 Tax=Cyanothece sp. (strain PCC 7425 / ATCC 29141) TaxID=395961 RepID=B8HW46_CYAP4